MPNDMFFQAYKPYDQELQAFGKYWCNPKQYEHGKETLVASFPKDPEDGDGQDCNVYCCALPARFYTIEVLPGVNSIGEPKSRYRVEFGSSMASLVATLAGAISEGMVVFSDSEE